MLNQFSEKERIEISKRLNLWFNNMNFKMSKIKFLGKICPNFTNFNFNQSERIINDLFKFKNDTLKVYTKKFYLNKDIITELTNSIENGVDENLHLIRFRDDNLKYKITIAPYLNYLDIINFNGFYGGFSFKFVKSYINKIINNHMKSLNVTNDKAELASKIDSIVNDPTSERTDNIGRFSSKIDINEYKKLSEIQENTYIKSKNFLAWQADGIKLNLQLGKIEKVNNNDVINDIIRRNSKLKFNNLYKVFINYEINYIYLTEEEFKDLISNTLLNVPFEYDIKFDPDKIVFFK